MRSIVARLCLAWGLLAAASWPAVALTIGQAIDLYGAEGDVGKDHFTGAQVYFDYLNAGGGFDGRPIRFISRDDEGKPVKTLAITRDLIDGGADVLFGYMGEDRIAAVANDPTFRSSGISLFAPLSGAAAGRGAPVRYLRTSYRDEAAHLLAFFRSAGLERIAVLHSDDAYGRSVAEGARAAFEQSRQRPAAVEILPSDPKAWPDTFERIRRADAQAVVVASDNLGSAMAVKAYRLAVPGTFLCVLSRANDRTLRELAGPDAARGTAFSQVVPDPSGVAVPVVAAHVAHMKQFRDEPATQFTLEGYLAAKALITILRSEGAKSGRAQASAAIAKAGKVDVGGVVYDLRAPRASRYVELTVLGRDGRLKR